MKTMKIKMESTAEQPLLLGPQLSPCPTNINLCFTTQAASHNRVVQTTFNEHSKEAEDWQDFIRMDIMEVKKHEMESAAEQALLSGSEVSAFVKDIKIRFKTKTANVEATVDNDAEETVDTESGSGQYIESEDPQENSDDLSESATVETSETHHQCDDCGKTFRYKNLLALHARVHTGERPFACDECGKRFALKGQLVQHLRVHTGETPYRCQYCGSKFKWMADLLKHVHSHTGEYPFSCAHCGKMFGWKSHLVQHVRTHTGEKPFACEICGRRFALKGLLVQHGRIHAGDTPFVCENCGARFGRKRHLEKHLPVHSSEK